MTTQIASKPWTVDPAGEKETVMAEHAPNPNLLIWLDGKLVPTAEARISVFDHGLLYGDGIFEGIRVYHGRIFEREAHMQRFALCCKAIRLELPWSLEEINRAMDETVRANKTVNGYIRLVATRGEGTLGIHPFRTTRPSVFIIVDKIQMYDPEMLETGMAVITSSVIRNHPNSVPPQIKSLNYLNNILAKIQAIDAGCPEAVMFNHEGYVAECTGDNLFIVQRGILRTPAPHCGLLEGVTRSLILRLAAKRGIPTEEAVLTRADLFFAEEMFITGTGAEVVPVVEIDKRRVGTGVPGPITRQLIADFRAYIKTGGAT